MLTAAKAHFVPHQAAALLMLTASAIALCWLNLSWIGTWVGEATLPAERATYNLNDYSAFVNASRLISGGQGSALYSIEAQRALEVREWGARFDQQLAVPFVNPPWFALVLLPLAGLPLGVGFLIWSVVCVGLVFGANAVLMHWARPPPAVGAAFVLSALGFVPFWRAAILGQTSALVLFGMALGIVFVARRQDRWGGILLALVGVKPQLLVLPLLGLIGARRWRAAAWCVAASVALLASGLLVTGPGAVGDYLKLLGSPDYGGYENLPQMQSWRALVEGTAGLSGAPAALLDGLGSLAAVAAVAWTWLPASAECGVRSAECRSEADSRLSPMKSLLRATHSALRTPHSALDWDLRMALTLMLTQLFTPHIHIHDLLIWFVPGALLLHYLYSPEAAGHPRRRDAGFVLLWSGYLVVWPAWLLPDARLALVFSLMACGWMAFVLHETRRERTAWAKTATTQ
ncbi:MAG: glycosyltransferase family 87 protein [Chloroflexia bacterium]